MGERYRDAIDVKATNPGKITTIALQPAAVQSLAFLDGPRIRPPSARPRPGAERTAVHAPYGWHGRTLGSGVRCPRLQSIRAFPEGFEGLRARASTRL